MADPGPLIVGIGPDGTGGHAAIAAAGLAATLGTRVVLVFGYDITSIGPRGGPLEEQLEAIAREELATVQAAVSAAHPGVQVDVEPVRDKPVEALLRAGEALGASMLVVGHGGGGVLRAAMLGSTTYGLVHRATLPVLVVPDPEESTDE